jgi:hypothetical protein
VKFTVDYPVVVAGDDPALVTAAGMTRVAQVIEDNGYDAIAFSEHPAPSHGHDRAHRRGTPAVRRDARRLRSPGVRRYVLPPVAW